MLHIPGNLLAKRNGNFLAKARLWFLRRFTQECFIAFVFVAMQLLFNLEILILYFRGKRVSRYLSGIIAKAFS